MGLSFMPAVGVGIATTALVGRRIGQGRRDRARRAARSGLLAAMIYMGLCGLAFWLLRVQMIRFFLALPGSGPAAAARAGPLAEEIVRVGSWILVFAAVFQLFDAASIVYVGALRGAGDTRWPMVATILMSWSITLGVGAAAVVWLPHWGSLGPWVAASLYTCALAVVLAWRFESGAWEKIDLLRHGAGAVGIVEDSATVPELVAGPAPDAAAADPPEEAEEFPWPNE
jgi:MATE family multidrug resistance protein